MAERVSQEVIEATYTPDGSARISQTAVEVVYLPDTVERNSQTAVEVLYEEFTGVSTSLLGGAQLFAPVVNTNQFVIPDPLGPVSIYSPSLGTVVAPSILGGSAQFTPTVVSDQSVQVGVLGGSQVFAPTVSLGAIQTVEPGLLGGAQIFAPTLVLATQTVQIPLLGPATISAPTVIPEQFLSIPKLGGAFSYRPTLALRTISPTILGGPLLGGAKTLAPNINVEGFSGTMLAPGSTLTFEEYTNLYGTNTGPTTIRYNGADITAAILWRPTTFTSRANGQVGTCSIWIKDLGHDFLFTTGREITIEINGLRHWGGYVTGVKRKYFYEGTATSAELTPRAIVLEGSDYNLLMQKRVLYHKTNPTAVQLTTYLAGQDDDGIIKHYMAEHMDLADDDIGTQLIEHVGTPSLDDEISGAAGWTWAEFMAHISQNIGSVYYIDPDRRFVYTDVDTPNAPFGISDNPGVGEVGCRDLEIDFDGTQLRNDALAWGAGQGQDEMVFQRIEDSTSQVDHGRWQVGSYHGAVWKQETIDRIANSLVYGSPQNKRGGKDDRTVVRCTIFEHGIRVADKVTVSSDVHGYSDVLPVRQLDVTFATSSDPQYRLTLSHEIDTPWTSFDPLPPISLPPFPPIDLPPLPPFPVFDPCAEPSEPVEVGDTWDTSETAGGYRCDVVSDRYGISGGSPSNPGNIGYRISAGTDSHAALGSCPVAFSHITGETHKYKAWHSLIAAATAPTLSELQAMDSVRLKFAANWNDSGPDTVSFTVYRNVDTPAGGFICDPSATWWSDGEAMGNITLTANRTESGRKWADGPYTIDATGAGFSTGVVRFETETGTHYLDLDITRDTGGTRVRAVELSGGGTGCTETFTRSVSGGWGTGELFCKPWSSSVNGSHAVSGSEASITAAVSGIAPRDWLTVTEWDGATLEFTARMRIPAAQTGVGSGFLIYDGSSGTTDDGPIIGAGLTGFRWTALLTSTGDIWVGTFAAPLTAASALAIDASPMANTWFRIKCRLTDTSISTKAWREGDAEPGYQVTVNGTGTTWLADLAADANIFAAFLSPNNLMTVDFDDLEILSGAACSGTCGDPCADAEPGELADPPRGYTCQDLVEIPDPPSRPTAPTYFSAGGTWSPKSEKVWLDGLFLRRGIDYDDLWANGWIAIDESIDTTGKTVHMCAFMTPTVIAEA